MPASTTLRFGSDQEPGIRRTGRSRFGYVNERTGKPAARADVERARSLAIPPAWTDVWIAADAQSHLQATGRDARGRKQYRYHRDFTSKRSDDKFADLLGFGAVLGSLRGRVTRDLAGDDLGLERVVATVVRLMDITSLRVGNAEYAAANDSFGLTTLRNRHVDVRGSTVRMSFRGKSAHEFDVRVDNKRLASIVRRCQHLPGQQLFEYRDVRGDVRRVSSSDVNEYLAEHAGPGVTAKTFRTWNATVRTADGLAAAAAQRAEPDNATINEVIDAVAAHLGNTRAVCRASYVHPVVVQRYVDGTLRDSWQRRVGAKPAGLTVVERKTLRVLRQ